MEEERERELERLYETGIADSLNREDAAVGSGVDGASAETSAAEATGVSKQTTETLMAGERIIEAIDIAEEEINTFREYEEAKANGGLSAQIAPPPRNPILAAYEKEPEEYVLMVIERVSSTALYDALLVLPFSKVVSLMRFLNHWAERVRTVSISSARALDLTTCIAGVEPYPHVADYLLSAEDSSSPGCCQPCNAYGSHTLTKASARSLTQAEGHTQL